MSDVITVTAISERLLSIQVCANSEDEAAVLDLTNRMYMCGTSEGWHVAEEPENRPRPCLDLVGHTHYVFHA